MTALWVFGGVLLVLILLSRLWLGVQVRLGALVAIALGAGVPAIRWYQNSLRREAPAAKKTAAA